MSQISPTEVKQRMECYKEVCHNAGVKLTHQRLEIYREMATTGDHPDADIVFKRVRKRLPTMSLDTVYRTLWLLTDLGLITTLGPSRERTRFDANLKHHHHFKCVNCGLTQDFYNDEFDAIPIPDSVQAIGSVDVTRVEIRGICHKCGGKG